MTDATRYFDLPSPFPMKRGGALAGARLAYETWGALNPARDNAIFILTGLSPSAHAASSAADPSPGWWEDMIGAGKPIDTNPGSLSVRIRSAAAGSTGPASIDPQPAKQIDFSDLTLEDVANSSHELVRSLGIERLACLVGNSMGGMSALGYLVQHPGSVRAPSAFRPRRQHNRSRSRSAPCGEAISSIELERRQLRRRALPRSGHVDRAQAQRNHVPVGDGMGRPLRSHPPR
jgi:homoserine O-acetyltransferase